MQLNKKEVYEHIVSAVHAISEHRDINKELAANVLGIGKSTWYVLKSQSKKPTNITVFSPKRLKTICKLIGITIEDEIFQVKIKPVF